MSLPPEYFKDETAVVYNCRLETILDILEFDYIITDPPYNVGYKYPDFVDKMSSDDYIEMLSRLQPYKSVLIHYPEEFCGDVGEALGKPNKCVFWCYSSNLPRQSRMIAWYGCNPDFSRVRQPYKDLKDKRIQKLIAQGSTGAKLYDWWSDIQLVKRHTKQKESSFTNQIPIQLLERILLITTNPGDIVVDPFFGSGSLYFACKKTGRRCIGIEQSSIHLQSFKRRLDTQ